MIGFLLGSGFSCPAGMPSVDEITKNILDHSKPVGRNQYGHYYFNPRGIQPSDGDGDYWIRECRYLLALLKREGDAFYKKNRSRKTNYEDLDLPPLNRTSI